MAAGDLPTPADLQVALSNRQDIALSAIHGEKMTSKHGAVVSVLEHVKSWQQTGFKWIGTLPEDAALRHPFYNRLYQTRRADLSLSHAAKVWNRSGLSVAYRPTGLLTVLSGLHTTSPSPRLRVSCSRWSGYGNVSAMLRWLSPFFAAQSNTIRTWGRSRTATQCGCRAALIWNAPNRAGLSWTAKATYPR